MTTIRVALTDPLGRPRQNAVVNVQLIAGPIHAGHVNGTGEVIGENRTTKTGPDGVALLELTPNVSIDPDGTYYRITSVGSIWQIDVPVSGLYDVGDPAIQVVTPVPPDWVSLQGPPGVAVSSLALIDPMDAAYGAVGDGVADDTAAIAAAVAVGAGMGRYVLHLRQGHTFLIGGLDMTGPFVLTGGGTVKKKNTAPYGIGIFGTGATVTGLRFASGAATGQPNTDIKMMQGATSVKITDNHFNGSTALYSAITGAADHKDGVPPGAIYTPPVTGVVIADNTFDGYIRPLYMSSVTALTITGNYFTGSSFDAIRLRENGGFVTVADNVFWMVGDQSWPEDSQTRDCIDCYYSGYKLTISGNIMYRPAYHAIDLKGGLLDIDTGSLVYPPVLYPNAVTITGNVITEPKHSGVNLMGFDASFYPNPALLQYNYIQGIVIDGNVITGCNRQATADSDAAVNVKQLVRDLVISNNIIRENQCRGIWIRNDTAAGAGTSDCRDITVTGNHCTNNGRVAGGGFGILLQGVSWAKVTGNTCVSDASQPNSTMQGTGIQVNRDGNGFVAASQSVVVVDNVARGHGTANINLAPTTGYADCIAEYRGNITDAGVARSWMSQRRLLFTGAVPGAAEGSFVRGDLAFNIAPTSVSNLGWVCTASGNPGTWYAFGAPDPAVATNTTAIATETAARIAADSTLTTNVATNTSGLAAEVTARTNADSTLTTAVAAKLVIASNLSDLANTTTARTNLGLGTAAVTNTGTGAGNTILGNDARLTDTRTPTALSVVDASVSASAAIAESKLALASDAAAGTASRRTLGTGALQATAGNDARLSDTRSPTAGSVVNASVSASAAIAYSKLALGTSIVNADIATAAAIAYSKLSLTGSIVDGDVAAANKDGAAGTASMRTLGTGAAQAYPGSSGATNATNIATNATAISTEATARAAADTTLTTAVTNAAPPVDIQVFTTPGSQTWTRPTAAAGVHAYTEVEAFLLGGGAGGGSGRKGATSSVRCGGGGGGGGAFTRMTMTVAQAGTSNTVVVGAGGAGGASQSSNSADGNPGILGGVSSFGALRATGGGAGGAGTATTGTAGGAGTGITNGGLGGAASTTGLLGAAGIGASLAAGAGGAGGGITSTNTASAGGAGGNAFVSNPSRAGGVAGAIATNGSAPATASSANEMMGGAGGGGGGSSLVGDAGSGGAGAIYGGGGGGGGSALDSTGNSGAGGAGQNGIVIIITR